VSKRGSRWIALMTVLVLLAAAASACQGLAPVNEPEPLDAQTSAPANSGAVTAVRGPLETCAPDPVLVPTPPATIPRYAELDETTGLHLTGVVPEEIDLTSWRLQVDGQVANPLSLTYDEIRCMSLVTAAPTLVCPGFFVDEAEWSGVPLREVLGHAGAPTQGVRVRLYGADGYSQQVSIGTAMSPSSYLAYLWEGEPLPYIHGFPLRAVFPGSDGNYWVKWLYRIEVF